jgi:histidinol-phosphatase (PHP family)
MFDCHVHSSFSGDSEMPAETACDKAIAMGLKGIAFTDHLDCDYPNYDSVFDIDFTAYNRFMDSIKESYRGKLHILKGIEVGIQPHVLERTLKVTQKYPFDFVIGSVHVIDGMDPYFGEFTRGKEQKDAYSRYLQEVLFTIEHFHDFDMLGHIDYIRRYGDYDVKTLEYKDYSEQLDTILKALLHKGKGLEINAAGFRYAITPPLVDFRIIKRYRELGGELICAGSDAHAPQHIAHHFDMIRDMLLEAGFQYTVHFEERKPVFDRLE